MTNRRREAFAPLPAVPSAGGQTLDVARDDAPLWVPDGVALDLVPHEVRQAVARLVQPAYRQFVLDVDDPLEKSLGVTVVHLLWLEILQQYELKRQYANVSTPLGLSENYHAAIDQHLRIMDGKVRVGHFLVRLRQLRDRQSSPGYVLEPGKNEIC